MRFSMRAIFQGLLWFAAVNFAALAVTVLMLVITGAVGVDRWTGALQVLRGTSGAVPKKKLARLREVEKLEQRRSEWRDEANLIKSWRDLVKEKARLQERKAQELEMLEFLKDAADAKLTDIEKAKSQWSMARKRAERDRIDREAELKRRASEKVRRIYRHMSPRSVARDLESRMAKDRADEVAEFIRAMSDRSAAEILEAFEDPARRMEVYDAMAGLKGRKAGEEAPE